MTFNTFEPDEGPRYYKVGCAWVQIDGVKFAQYSIIPPELKKRFVQKFGHRLKHVDCSGYVNYDTGELVQEDEEQAKAWRNKVEFYRDESTSPCPICAQEATKGVGYWKGQQQQKKRAQPFRFF